MNEFQSNVERVKLILLQLEKSRELTDVELRVFEQMVTLNEYSRNSYTVQEMMQKHQKSLDIILKNG
jgi:hypothetical protein